MARQLDGVSSANVTLEPHDIQTANLLIDRLAELVTGRRSRKSPLRAKASHELACQILEARRSRAALFSSNIFDEPAWDILLHLYCAAEESEVVTYHRLSENIAAPATTIERWIDQLIERCLIERGPNLSQSDYSIALSRNGLSKLDTYFEILIEHHFRI